MSTSGLGMGQVVIVKPRLRECKPQLKETTAHVARLLRNLALSEQPESLHLSTHLHFSGQALHISSHIYPGSGRARDSGGFFSC